MGEAFITRRGGTAVGTAAPSINFVSSTFDSITFTITNNDALTADIFWEIGDSTPDANTLSLAGGATSSNQVASGLDAETSYTIFAFANAEGKAGSQTSTNVQTTPAEPLVYTAATGGTTAEYDSGGKRFKSHTFTSDGTFTVTTVGDATDDRNKVDYLIIAGGAGGGGGKSGGGGGAGGYLTTLGATSGDVTVNAKVVVTAQGYSIDVGAGGTGGVVAGDGVNGDNSVAFSITATGGGGGSRTGGENGGSGGGGSLRQESGGTGIAGQGFDGSASFNGAGDVGSGAGGGAGQAGQASTATVGGNGGNGLANLLRTGSNESRAGGGGGGASSVSSAGTGGTGGGGNGGLTSGGTGGNATVNTGSGGGGGSIVGLDGDTNGGNGAAGLVVIRYEIAPSV